MTGALPPLWQVLLGLLASTMASPGPPITHDSDCFQRPSKCGYPDATNTGVRPGTTLTNSGSIIVRESGATLDALDIKGTVTVAADRVTVRNSRITVDTGGSGTYGVILEAGADDFTIEDSEVSGRIGAKTGLESAVWNHHNNTGASAVRSYFHGCADCWEGAGTFRDDYIVVDAAYPGSHDENIYVCGAKIDVDHSTLINRHSQTAAVFGDTAGCGPNRFKVTNSLLAGGGYVVYPQANSDSPTGSMNVSGNHFARCRTRPVFDSHSGGTACRNGPDSSGLFPHGGYYGFAAAYYRGKHQIWKQNVWDDNLRPVCISEGC